MDRRRRATWLVLAGVALLVGTVAGGAITAPSLAAGEGDADRRTLVGSQSAEGGWHEGGAVMSFEGESETWREDSAANYFDVDPLADGRVLAAFSDGGYQQACDPYEPPCHKTGYRIIDPDAEGGPAVTEEWTFPVRNAASSEVHDVDMLPSGEVLVADMEHERIFTLRDGDITWEWSASELYTQPPDPTREDWLHINDVDAINDTHYLTSVRNANQLVIVERGEGAVRIINQDRGEAEENCDGLTPGDDGEVRCGDPAVINHQHNPQWLDSGAVLVADSDNDRVVELHRDPATGRWAPAWTVESAGGVPLHWPRDADRQADGTTLITDTFNSRVVEVAPNGTTLGTIQLYNLPYEADRLPGDEPVGAPRYAGGGEIADPSGSGMPVVTELTEAAKGQFPVIPFWFAELHLVLVAIAVALAAVGGIEHALLGYRARTSET